MPGICLSNDLGHGVQGVDMGSEGRPGPGCSLPRMPDGHGALLFCWVVARTRGAPAAWTKGPGARPLPLSANLKSSSPPSALSLRYYPTFSSKHPAPRFSCRRSTLPLAWERLLRTCWGWFLSQKAAALNDGYSHVDRASVLDNSVYCPLTERSLKNDTKHRRHAQSACQRSIALTCSQHRKVSDFIFQQKHIAQK